MLRGPTHGVALLLCAGIALSACGGQSSEERALKAEQRWQVALERKGRPKLDREQAETSKRIEQLKRQGEQDERKAVAADAAAAEQRKYETCQPAEAAIARWQSDVGALVAQGATYIANGNATHAVSTAVVDTANAEESLQMLLTNEPADAAVVQKFDATLLASKADLDRLVGVSGRYAQAEAAVGSLVQVMAETKSDTEALAHACA